MDSEKSIYYENCSINFEKVDGHFTNVHVIFGGSENGVDYIYDADVSSIEGAINFIDDLKDGAFNTDDDNYSKYENAYDQACNY